MKLSRGFVILGYVFLFLFVWQIVFFVKVQTLSPGETSVEAFIPTPTTVALTFVDKHKLIISEFFHTFAKAFLGLVIGIVASVLINMLFWFRPRARNLFFPIFLAINSFPIIGFSPLIIMTFGQGSWLSIVFISALICYFPVLISLENALFSISRDFQELGQIWGVSPKRIYYKIQLPLLLPYLFGSLRLAVPASIVGATLGEWLGSNHGIGRLVVIALYQLDPGLLYACLLLVLVFSLLVIYLVSVIEKLFFPWMVLDE
jgi:ABC-type nitrate/sulfonate/bicarbonate transport system permease component